jgi:cytochrome c peroxidase
MIKYVILLLICIAFLFSCLSNQKKVIFQDTHLTIQKKIDSLHYLLSTIETKTSNVELQHIFTTSRKYYKQIEPFIEYYYQGFCRRINGPALPEIKTEDNMVNEATGFQVIEEIIFSDSVDLPRLLTHTKILKTDLFFIKKNVADLPIQDHHFYELVQHQIIRIATHGITGFDSPIALHGIKEATYTLEGISEFYNQFCSTRQKQASKKLLQQIQQSILYCNQNDNFNGFNRLEFIKSYLMPMSELWEDDFKSTIDSTPNFKANKVFYGQLANLMKGEKLNADAFSPYAAAASSPQKIELGKLLFDNTALSKTKQLSCASCHNAGKAFTDGKIVSSTNIHSTTVNRNAPTLLYSAFQKGFFYDLRSQDLENQIESVMKNPAEFNTSAVALQKIIQSDTTLMGHFSNAFPEKKEITAYEIKNAIAAYVRNLMPFQSKIDNYFKGETTLTESEINGFNIFSGKAKCATCHFIPLYSGTIPPWFNNSESEVIGVPKTIAWKSAIVDDDLGRYNLNTIEQLKYAFKTPTIRNIEKTAPYMHNGVYNNLADVIKFYELGGGNGIGMSLSYQTLPFDNLQLSVKEKQDIISFLNALTDKY